MLSTLIAHAHGLVGRAVPLFLALQDAPSRAAPRPGGGGSSGGGGGAAGGLSQLLIPALMVVFIYFVMIRPMSKQRKEADLLNKSLQKGDKVVTNSGIVGMITGMDEQFITVEISEKVRVKFLREAITRKLDAGTAASKSETGAAIKTAEAKK